MTSQDARIALRLWLAAVWLRPLKRVVPLETLVRVMHRPAARRRGSPALRQRLEHYMERADRFPFRAPANCLERSLGAYRMLCRAGASPELVIGVRHAAGRGVEGHVWVTVDGHALAERPENLATYTAIARFDARGRRQSSDGSGPLLSGIPLR